MIYKVSYIKDSVGQNYLGIKFNEGQMDSYLKDLYDIVGSNEKFETLISNQARRDRREGSEYTHHITVISVMEYNQLMKNDPKDFQERINTIKSLDIEDLDFEGVGKAERDGNIAYFVVVESPILDEFRSSLGLEPKDFHVTLGFDKKDVFGVRKNQVLKKKTKFSKLVDINYSIHNGSHLWLYEIGNYPDGLKVPEDKIEISDRNDSIITYRIDHTKVQIGLIDQGNGDEMWILTKSEFEDV